MARQDPVRSGAAVVREAALLLAAALVAATTAWALRTPRLPLRADETAYLQEWAAPVISAGEAVALYAAGSHHFVDTRDPAPGAARVPGAFVIRPDSFADDLLAAADFIYPEDPIVLYGSGDAAPVSSVAARFQERGYAQVVIMLGDLAGWRAAGGPTSGGAGDE